MAPMMAPMLRLYEDVLASDAEISVPAHPRMIYVVHGAIIMGDLSLRDDEAFGSEKCRDLQSGARGGDALALGASPGRRSERRKRAGRRFARKTLGAARHHAQRGGAVAW